MHKTADNPNPISSINNNLKTPPLASNIGKIANAALSVSDSRSESKGLVAEREQSLAVLRFDAKPRLVASGRVNQFSAFSGSDEVRTGQSFRLGLKQSLLDFGQFASRNEQAYKELSIAQIEYWIERNQTVHDALVSYFAIDRQNKLIALVESFIEKHRTLKKQITERVRGGVANKSELSVIDIRLNELYLEKDSDQRLLQSARVAFDSETELQSIPGVLFADQDFVLDLQVAEDSFAPAVLASSQQVALASDRRIEAKSHKFPGLELDVFVETLGEEAYGIELNVNSDNFSGFSSNAEVRAANLAIESAEAAFAKTRNDFVKEKQQLSMEFTDLLRRKESLESQHVRTNESVDLFFEQLKIGNRPITDAINVYESALFISRELVVVQSDILLNRLQAANISGTLTAYTDN